MMKKLHLGIPKGSLQEATIDMMKKAGYSVHISSGHIILRLMMKKFP